MPQHDMRNVVRSSMLTKPGVFLIEAAVVCLVLLSCMPAATQVRTDRFEYDDDSRTDCTHERLSGSNTAGNAFLQPRIWNVFCSETAAVGDDSLFMIEKRSSSRYVLRVMGKTGKESRWVLPYPVFRFMQSDLDNDGVAEALVGVEKETRFDPVRRKRLFVFGWRRGAIRPVWLGSKMAGNLLDFKTVTGPSGVMLQTIEADACGNLHSVCLWRWGSFGPRFVKYVCAASSPTEADRIFKKTGGAE